MDTSAKNIKMCEEAKEIQKLYYVDDYPHDETVKDYLACKKHKRLITWEGSKAGFRCPVNTCLDWASRDGVIWLPTQDQLQKIAFPLCVEQGFSGLPSRSYQYIWCLHEFMLDHYELSGGCRTGRCDWYPNQMSLEQWWLMLIMDKKYNKVWDNKKEEWICME